MKSMLIINQRNVAALKRGAPLRCVDGATAAAAALLTLAAVAAPASALESNEAPLTSTPVPTVFFGNGCFWGRQHDMVETELGLGRTREGVSAVVGYAGGAAVGPSGKVCYYYSDPRTVYERLGHAEVVAVDVGPDGRDFRAFADTYFREFRRLRDGRMQRLDPQDAGPGYRNVIGLPGGVNSPLYRVLQDANPGMELRAGEGNQGGGAAIEDDLINVVWVVDSNKLPFHRAERYHQFHNGLGKAFPASYTRDLKELQTTLGKIDGTGCPEFPF